MRELWATGWVQQSARMAAASFLTEYLNLPWVEGERARLNEIHSMCVRRFL